MKNQFETQNKDENLMMLVGLVSFDIQICCVWVDFVD